MCTTMSYLSPQPQHQTSVRENKLEGEGSREVEERKWVGKEVL